MLDIMWDDVRGDGYPFDMLVDVVCLMRQHDGSMAPVGRTFRGKVIGWPRRVPAETMDLEGHTQDALGYTDYSQAIRITDVLQPDLFPDPGVFVGRLMDAAIVNMLPAEVNNENT